MDSRQLAEVRPKQVETIYCRSEHRAGPRQSQIIRLVNGKSRMKRIWVWLVMFGVVLTSSSYGDTDPTRIKGWRIDGKDRMFVQKAYGTIDNLDRVQNGCPGEPRKSEKVAKGDPGDWAVFEINWPDTKGAVRIYVNEVRACWATSGVSFGLDVSLDGTGWEELLSSRTRSEGDWERYNLPEREANYVRIRIGGETQGRLRYIMFLGRIDQAKAPFVHPGRLNSLGELEKWRQLVKDGVRPNVEAYEALTRDKQARREIDVDAQERIIWTTVLTDKAQKSFSSDMKMAHKQAMMWNVTRELVYAENVLKIMDEWQSRLKAAEGHASLSAFGGMASISAAVEIVKYTYSGWDADIEAGFLAMIDRFVLPHAETRHFKVHNNWSTQLTEAIIGMAVWRDNRYHFNRAVERIRLDIDYAEEHGEIHELCSRDWNHAAMHISRTARAVETAWQQGVDMYGYRNNHLGVIFDYFAAINIQGGQDGVYTKPVNEDCVDGKILWQSGEVVEQGPTGFLIKFGLEYVYNHYDARRGSSGRRYLEEYIDWAREEGMHDIGNGTRSFGSLTHANVGDAGMAAELAVTPHESMRADQ